MAEDTGLLSSNVSAGDDGLASQYNNLRADTKKMRQEEMTAGATIAGATLPVPVYQNTSDNEVYACDANVATALEFLGFAISDGTDGNAIIVQHTGIVGGFTGLDEGEKYYVQDAIGTIGKAKGTYKILVGRAISSTELLILKEDPKKTIGFVAPFYTYQIPFVIMADAGSIWASNNYANWAGSGASAYTAAITYINTKLLGTDIFSFYQFDQAKKIIMTIPVVHSGVSGNVNDSLVFGISVLGAANADGISGASNAELLFFYDQDDGKLYAKSCNGTNEEHTEISGWTQADSRALNIFRIEFDGNGGTSKFYINDVLKATHTTYTPNSASDVYIKISQEVADIIRAGIPTISIEK